MPEYSLGKDCKLYRNTGTFASPTWNEVEKTVDLRLSLEKGEADVSARSNGGWKAVAGTMKDGTVEFDLILKDGDADAEAFRDAFLNDTDLECLILNGPVTTPGKNGLRATMQVLKCERVENLNEGVKLNVRIKPTLAANAPSWYTAS